MASENRRQRIVELVGETGEVSIAELAAATGASEMTIRRDLDALSAQGVVERYRGGARSVVLRGEEPPFAVRAADGTATKRWLADEVAGLIADGESVVLDSGTTCMEVARVLAARRVTVMPLSLHAVTELAASTTVTLLVPGGSLRPGELAFVGPLALDALARLRFDTAVLGCCGLGTAHGMTAYDLDDAAVKKAAIASARRVVAVAEAAKFSRTALAHVAPVVDLDVVVTDDTAPPDELDALREAGVSVRQVPGRSG